MLQILQRLCSVKGGKSAIVWSSLSNVDLETKIISMSLVLSYDDKIISESFVISVKDVLPLLTFTDCAYLLFAFSTNLLH